MKNNLTQAEFFRLCNWLAGQQERLIENAPKLTTLAEEAGKFLDRPKALETGTIKRAIETAGLKYVPKVEMGGRAHGKYAAALQKMDLRLKQLEAENLWLCATVRGMARELGYKIPGEGQPALGLRVGGNVANGQKTA